MTTTDERLARMEQRQEALISAISDLADISIQTRTMVGELVAWLQKPPTNDLPEFLERVAQAVESNTDSVHRLSESVEALGQTVNALR